jgi:pimeloyl-ACP methyl ester carboxylesterase
MASSPPRTTLITVADSVQLEVVDWGGEGPTLILLAGLGHTAHVFDGFAPRLTSYLHVMGITRRGVGASSRPKQGYDSTTLVRDLVAALASRKLAKASFAGHSFAGSEMSILAARFPERVERLIYLDSGFDYRQLLDRIGVATALGSPQPPEGAYNRGTVADWTLYGERSSGAGFPESEVRAMFRVGADGIVQGSATAPETPRAMLDGIEPAPLAKIRAPTLAIYAAPTSAEVMYPSWYAFDDSARQRGRTVYAAVSAEHKVQRARFKREVAGSRQVIITGARHYLFLTHPGEVAHEILSFMLNK